MSTQTLCGTQNVDAVAITGGTIAGVNISTSTISGGSLISPVITGATISPGSGRYGTFVINGTTPVTISSSSLAITDIIIMSLNTVGGTVGVQPHVATITAGQATIVGTASDSSTYNYQLVKNA